MTLTAPKAASNVTGTGRSATPCKDGGDGEGRGECGSRKWIGWEEMGLQEGVEEETGDGATRLLDAKHGPKGEGHLVWNELLHSVEFVVNGYRVMMGKEVLSK